MKHMSVGEGTSMPQLSHEWRRRDEEYSARLTAICRRGEGAQAVDAPVDCNVCHNPLPENAKDQTCKRCRNREAMAEARARRAASFASGRL